MPRLADRGTRFVANFIDSMVPVVPMVLTFVMLGVLGSSEMGKEVLGGTLVLIATLLMMAALGLQLVLVIHNGQSLGKRIMRIKVVSPDGRPVSAARIIFMRNLVPQIIGAFCGVFGLIDALLIFRSDQRCLHDLMAETIVVQAPRSP